MSRNLYLGADLNPAVGAASIADAIDGAGVVYNQLEAPTTRSALPRSPPRSRRRSPT